MKTKTARSPSLKRIALIALSIGATAVMTPARSEWAVGAGAEHLNWRESTSPGVKETGLRWALNLTWTQDKEAGFSAGYNFKFYAGHVDYRGAFLFSGIPSDDETRYRGFVNEARLFYRMTPNPVAFMAALGWDRWDRRIISNGQDETWNILYAKLGVTVNDAAKQGVLASIGAKYPLYTSENVHFTDLSLGLQQNPRVHPGRQFSAYGTLGYRFNPSWDVIAYYDSFRFRQSDNVALSSATTSFTAFQPESKMDVIGIKAQYNF